MFQHYRNMMRSRQDPDPEALDLGLFYMRMGNPPAALGLVPPQHVVLLARFQYGQAIRRKGLSHLRGQWCFLGAAGPVGPSGCEDDYEMEVMLLGGDGKGQGARRGGGVGMQSTRMRGVGSCCLTRVRLKACAICK
jgi:hypothetical protein